MDIIEQVVKGKRRVAEYTVATLLAGGHILLEDVPGVGKTLLALTVAKVLNLSFKRFQFTSDTLPADLLGVFIYDPKKGDFVFKPGPIFTNILLADEINRSSPKTQSALLEAMAEKQVTVEGETFKLPKPFFVIATQNPLEEWGTFPLPHSQLDRFMIKTSVGYPPKDVELEILKGEDPFTKLERIPRLASSEVILKEQKKVEEIEVPNKVAEFALNVVVQTRKHPDVKLGVSTRGLLQWVQFAKALTRIRELEFLPLEILKECVVEALAHRLILKESSLKTPKEVVEEIVQSVG